MEAAGSLQLPHHLGTCKNHNHRSRNEIGGSTFRSSTTRVSSFLVQHCWSIRLSMTLQVKKHALCYRKFQFRCRSSLKPGQPVDITSIKNAVINVSRSYSWLQSSPLVLKLIPAVGIIAFGIWGLEPILRQSRNLFLRKSDSSWNKSNTYHVMTSYLQPLVLWTGAMLVCRAVDPMVLPTEASQIVKQRLLNFVRSLSTVLAFAYCLSSVIQQTHKFFMETNDPSDTRNMGFQFAGKAVYTAVWVAAVSLFMELLGFSTQKWLTAGGLGTVLLTLAGREIFTNFLSSMMIHATRPFVLNEWIQTKIEGYEVSGTVEHVGWWSPTIIRGEDREAVHIPNHKFTVNVVRNLSQKTHWRIKTHLAISHLDVSKINNIVADMRKVLSKNPQVEQKKLHKRVFLEDVNPENQALLILISCFVKTSHFEEYLCVKEAILLDLLRVIRHHRARLATPIRTVQKIYGDLDLDNIPYDVADPIFNRGATSSRQVLLIEPTKVRTVREEDSLKGERSTPPPPDNKAEPKANAITSSTPDLTKLEPKVGQVSHVTAKTTSKPASKLDQNASKPPSSSSKSAGIEENIVLGVALEGSKRTLPIEEAAVKEVKELSMSHSSSSNGSVATSEKDKQPSPRSSSAPPPLHADQQE
ncbi:hypothetical protein DM860_014070 [Cuscuta australis]|uniref:Mechanosensitive ion channel protein n=1 Tax=Cuscuta australis TaxID=267555 RepID=A0A328DEH3_9ASTE|nr:hypothetical protein DM860_014070 [Cuscuta australis]